MPTLGDLKPSEVLCQARGFISATFMSDAVLCEILMSKLPQQVQTALSVILCCTMDEFARTADRAMCRFSNKFATSNSHLRQLENEVQNLKLKVQNQSINSNLQNISRYSQPRPRSQNHQSNFNRFPVTRKVCFFHQRFGPHAHKYVGPCNWMPKNY